MILLMGIAGSGKGTQGKLLAEKDGYDVISTGELLRTHGSEEQHQRMQKGENLRDDEVTALLQQVLDQISNRNRVILDGYPRRISQAKWLLEQQQKGSFKLTCVIHLTASQESVNTRLLERGRLDDNGDGIAQRFKEYAQDTIPILTYLKQAGVKIKEVNAEQSIDAVHDEIVSWLREHAV